MPFHIDYRPETFEEFFGNEEIIEQLEAFIVKEEIPHTILFSGPSGCGKTTLARLLTKSVDCTGADLIEINTSNNRGIDTAREIISSSNYKTISGKARVYILDEIHQTNKAFQNALLKILEDTPDHIYFILCTTEPQQLLKTIINRCHHFTVSPLYGSELLDLLSWVLESEKKELDEKTLKEITKRSDGSPRKALIYLEQVIGVDEDKRKAILDSVMEEEREIIDLCRAIVKRKKWKVVATILKGIDQEPEKVRQAILGYFNSVLLGGDESAAWVIECFSEPFFYSGKAALSLACFQALGNGD